MTPGIKARGPVAGGGDPGAGDVKRGTAGVSAPGHIRK
jgi:hypothetical protein